MDNMNQIDPYLPDFKSECIIAKKVYAQCQQRACFENLEVKLPCDGTYEFVDIKFLPGKIFDEVITPIPNRTNFKRARFRVVIKYRLRVRNIETGSIVEIKGQLPDILKDIVLFMPESRDEFNFKLVLETATQLLADPFDNSKTLVLAVGVFIIVKVVGEVQLLIPAFGFCPEPDECEAFLPDDVCKDFDVAPFPDFFPKQFEDIYDDEENDFI
ncbi:hypothetical protein RH915_01185 [Serpentinicella sp. ANB-PHB4]|uniref:hypothetical protein n=1 Tax=Serpentinicella sp. ANB-PHB4 TaxID=3074076 RepID=UPI0028674197|nr:hypothetical protein [Serpentinicella sp. ANB-PHB4]MDR5658092.1 hypothetical protein [Serpentinicella sp. ANB-PHB4]